MSRKRSLTASRVAVGRGRWEEGKRDGHEVGREEKKVKEEEGVEVSRRNLQKYIAAQEAGSNRASSVPRDPRYRRAISRRLVAGDCCSARCVELRKSELACPPRDWRNDPERYTPLSTTRNTCCLRACLTCMQHVVSKLFFDRFGIRDIFLRLTKRQFSHLHHRVFQIVPGRIQESSITRRRKLIRFVGGYNKKVSGEARRGRSSEAFDKRIWRIRVRAGFRVRNREKMTPEREETRRRVLWLEGRKKRRCYK